MSRIPRPPKPDDQEAANKALNLIQDLRDLNPEIEPTIWVAALGSAIVSAYIQKGRSYKEFSQEALTALKYYKHWFDDEY